MNKSKLIAVAAVILPLVCLAGGASLIWFEVSGHSLRPVATGMFEQQPSWTYNAADAITATPITDGAAIYVRTAGRICALNANTGRSGWCTSSPSSMPLSIAPRIVGDYLAVPERNSNIAVLGKEDGHVIWRASLDGANAQSEEIQGLAANGTALYVVRFNWALTAYDLLSGQVIWEQPLPSHATLHIASDAKLVYVAVRDSLRAYDGKTGKMMWQTQLEGYAGQIALDEHVGYLYVADSTNTKLVAIRLVDHVVVWAQPLRMTSTAGFGCLLVDGGDLFVASDELSMTSATNGQQKWTTNQYGQLECPVLVADKVFVRTTDRLLLELDRHSGTELSRLTVQANAPVENQPQRSPVFVNGLLVVPVTDRELSAYHL
jgi:outer membrane protein assembly factor BamB